MEDFHLWLAKPHHRCEAIAGKGFPGPTLELLEWPPASFYGFPGVTMVKNPLASAGDTRDLGSIPGSGRSPGAENGNLLQYSCLENPTDRGAWWATVHGVTKSQTRLSDFMTTSRHCIWSHHLMANRWGNMGNSDRPYFLGLQNHCRW